MVNKLLNKWHKEKCVQTKSATYRTVYTDACKTHYTIPVYTNVFLKMNPRFRNM
jgi:hypothetical protein